MHQAANRNFQEVLLLGLQQRMINLSRKEDMCALLQEMKELVLAYPLDHDIIDAMSLMVDRIVNLLNLDYISPTSTMLN